MYNQYKHCHLLWQLESSIVKYQISKKLLVLSERACEKDAD